jgi:hypothetical protein
MPETIITLDDLRGEISPQDFETLSIGDAGVAERAIQKAVIWVYGKVKSTRHDYDETNEVVRDCILKRAVYELYTYTGNESRARSKEEALPALL